MEAVEGLAGRQRYSCLQPDVPFHQGHTSQSISVVFSPDSSFPIGPGRQSTFILFLCSQIRPRIRRARIRAEARSGQRLLSRTQRRASRARRRTSRSKSRSTPRSRTRATRASSLTMQSPTTRSSRRRRVQSRSTKMTSSPSPSATTTSRSKTCPTCPT